MGGLVREAYEGPLCPGSYSPANIWHQIEVTFQDRLYTAMKRFRVSEAGDPDPEGELPPDLDDLYSEVAYNKSTSRMLLHSESTNYPTRSGFVTVEAYFWKCHLCGFILPATTVDRKP